MIVAFAGHEHSADREHSFFWLLRLFVAWRLKENWIPSIFRSANVDLLQSMNNQFLVKVFGYLGLQ